MLLCGVLSPKPVLGLEAPGGGGGVGAGVRAWMFLQPPNSKEGPIGRGMQATSLCLRIAGFQGSAGR